MKTNVDVLTLSATPIPRTLEMSPRRHPRPVAAADAAGRPPADPHLRRRVRRARRHRGDPPRTAPRGPGVLGPQPGAVDRAPPPAACASSCPRRASASPTGRWTRAASRPIVQDFWDGEYDVLVCTTIIESGIDMPTVNTLVVERSDLLGLGQMHQLRGPRRPLGISGPTPTCSTRATRSLTEEAYERLRTIGESTELGSGFKIAMRDLEIRGAGNLLGESQSGHIAAVGYDLYCQMVTEAVSEMKGEPQPDAAGRDQARRADRLVPADRLRRQGGAAARGLPSPRRRHRARPRSTTSAPSGRTATARCPSRPRRCSRSATCAPSATASASPTSRSRLGVDRRHRQARAARAEAQPRRCACAGSPSGAKYKEDSRPARRAAPPGRRAVGVPRPLPRELIPPSLTVSGPEPRSTVAAVSSSAPSPERPSALAWERPASSGSVAAGESTSSRSRCPSPPSLRSPQAAPRSPTAATSPAWATSRSATTTSQAQLTELGAPSDRAAARRRRPGEITTWIQDAGRRRRLRSRRCRRGRRAATTPGSSRAARSASAASSSTTRTRPTEVADDLVAGADFAELLADENLDAEPRRGRRRHRMHHQRPLAEAGDVAVRRSGSRALGRRSHRSAAVRRRGQRVRLGRARVPAVRRTDPDRRRPSPRRSTRPPGWPTPTSASTRATARSTPRPAKSSRSADDASGQRPASSSSGSGPAATTTSPSRRVAAIERIAEHRYLRTGRHPSRRPRARRDDVRPPVRVGRHLRRRLRRDRRRAARRRRRARRDPLRRSRFAARARAHGAVPARCADDRRTSTRGAPGDVVPRRRLRPARHRPGRGRGPARRRSRVRHRRRRRTRSAARRPHARQLGAVRHQAGRRRSHRRRAGHDPAGARHTGRADRRRRPGPSSTGPSTPTTSPRCGSRTSPPRSARSTSASTS